MDLKILNCVPHVSWVIIVVIVPSDFWRGLWGATNPKQCGKHLVLEISSKSAKIMCLRMRAGSK